MRIDPPLERHFLHLQRFVCLKDDLREVKRERERQ
jgi:hypothetical protein